MSSPSRKTDTALLEDLANVYGATLESMLDALLPAVLPAVLDDVCSILVSKGEVVGDRWTRAPTEKDENKVGKGGTVDAGEAGLPNKGSGELDAFVFIGEIFRETMACLSKDPAVKVDIAQRSTVPASIHKNTSRPAGRASIVSDPEGSMALSELDDWLRIAWAHKYEQANDRKSRSDVRFWQSSAVHAPHDAKRRSPPLCVRSYDQRHDG
ncbi:hypothetical protein OF83DRAFT_1179020 [Amylostereum chailletii]|nr:hypothetical protein OF83DRAFT_1179020 [Amylostereum chailletii]